LLHQPNFHMTTPEARSLLSRSEEAQLVSPPVDADLTRGGTDILSCIQEVQLPLTEAIQQEFANLDGWEKSALASIAVSRVLSDGTGIPIELEGIGEHIELAVGVYNPSQITDFLEKRIDEQTYVRYHDGTGRVYRINPLYDGFLQMVPYTAQELEMVQNIERQASGNNPERYQDLICALHDDSQLGRIIPNPQKSRVVRVMQDFVPNWQFPVEEVIPTAADEAKKQRWPEPDMRDLADAAQEELREALYALTQEIPAEDLAEFDQEQKRKRPLDRATAHLNILNSLWKMCPSLQTIVRSSHQPLVLAREGRQPLLVLGSQRNTGSYLFGDFPLSYLTGDEENTTSVITANALERQAVAGDFRVVKPLADCTVPVIERSINSFLRNVTRHT
jgi:hypothetical protein